MPYVYDYVTEEEFYKYKLNELLINYPKYEGYSAHLSIDRDRERVLFHCYLDRESFGQYNTYKFIINNEVITVYCNTGYIYLNHGKECEYFHKYEDDLNILTNFFEKNKIISTIFKLETSIHIQFSENHTLIEDDLKNAFMVFISRGENNQNNIIRI